MLTNYERDEKFKEIRRLLSEIEADERDFRDNRSNGAIRERLRMANECLSVAERAIAIRQGVIEP